MENKYTVSKNGELIKIVQGISEYEIYRNCDKSINLDTWLVKRGRINQKTVWEYTDIEGPIKEVGAVDFCGGIHGDERYKSVSFCLNGKSVSESESFEETKLESFEMYVLSDIFFCNDCDNVAFNRSKKITFAGDSITVENELTYIGKREYKVERWPACGIYSIFKDMMDGYRTNLSDTLITDHGIEPDKALDCVTFCGSDYTACVKALGEKGKWYRGWVNDFLNEPRPRFKAYLDTVNNCDEPCTLTGGERLSAAYTLKITRP